MSCCVIIGATRSRVNGAGLKNKDAVILFPLSSKLFLQCKWNSGWGNTFHFLSNEKIDYLNLWIVKGAHKQVYASEDSEEICLMVDQNIGTMTWVRVKLNKA